MGIDLRVCRSHIAVGVRQRYKDVSMRQLKRDPLKIGGNRPPYFVTKKCYCSESEHPISPIKSSVCNLRVLWIPPQLE